MFSQGENDCHQRPILPRKTRTDPRSPRIQPNAQLKNKTASKIQKVSKSPTALSRLPILRNWTATETLPRSPNRKHRTAQSIPCPKSTKPSLRTVKTKDTEAVARIPAASGTAILKDWKNERFYKRTPQETPLPQRLRDTTLQSILSRCLKKARPSHLRHNYSFCSSRFLAIGSKSCEVLKCQNKNAQKTVLAIKHPGMKGETSFQCNRKPLQDPAKLHIFPYLP